VSNLKGNRCGYTGEIDCTCVECSRCDEEETLADASRDANNALLHEIALSMASFIAAIDANSYDVARYIEQRLAPLIPLLDVDIRVREALERIGADGRHLKRDP
jgi:hypothetical protein